MKELVRIPVMGHCITRNGGTDVGLMTAIENDNGEAEIGFVSAKLHRSLNAGARLRVEDVDKFCETWLQAREKTMRNDAIQKLTSSYSLNDEVDEEDGADMLMRMMADLETENDKENVEDKDVEHDACDSDKLGDEHIDRIDKILKLLRLALADLDLIKLHTLNAGE